MRRRKSVAQRLLVSFGAVMTAFAVTLGYGVVALRQEAKDSELLRTGYVPLLLSLGAALENQNLVSAQLNHITEAKNPADARRWIETARKLRPLTFAEVRSAAERGVAPLSDDHARQMASRIVSDTTELEAFLSSDGDELLRMFDALAREDQDLAERERDRVMAHEVEGARRLRELKGRVDGELDRLIGAARVREGRALQSLGFLAALTLIVGAAMTIHARRVLRPLAQVTERANAVAAGDLQPRAVVATSDEIGELAAKFEWMVAAIAKANHDRLQSERLAVVGRMAAHVTHEIRNPLSSIGLNLELLEEELLEGDLSAESRQLLQAIRREVDHLSSLSEQYLSLARPQRPRLVRESLGDLVTEVTDFLAPELKRAGVALRVEIAENLPEAMLDETQLRQALNNLIRNAREAMQPSGTLLVKVEAVGGSLQLTIEDSGVGIPEEIRASIFDAFFTTKNRGTGLGLAITRQIMEAHAGTIGCEAVEPHGTRFVIRIPVAEALQETELIQAG